MEQPVPDWREQEIRIDPKIYELVAGFILIMSGVVISAAFISRDNSLNFNLYTHVVSVFLTIFVLNTLAERREERRRVADLKARLLREARSKVNDIAVKAIEEIRANGWLEGEQGLLKGADLSGTDLHLVDAEYVNFNEANLSKSNFSYAILEWGHFSSADLAYANLSHAALDGADFSHADLYQVDLSHSVLYVANLNGANLLNANLSGAFFRKADFRGASLFQANLKDANFYESTFDETTRLPDRSMWTLEKHAARWWEAYGAVWLDTGDWMEYKRERGLQ